MSRVWEPSEGESARAFSCFAVFRDLGPERTLRSAAALHYGKEDGPTQGEYDTVKRWSAAHDWTERVRHYDGWLQMERRDAIQEHLREKAEGHARRESQLRDQALEVREKALEKARAMLAWPLAEQRRRVEDGPEGEAVYEFHPVRWNFSTAVNLFAMSQNNAGLTEEEIAATGTLDFSGLTDEEMIALIELQGKVEVKPPQR